MPTSSNLYDKRIEKLFVSSRSKSYPKNQLIHYQGDPISHIYLIREGYVKAYTILDSGDTRTILLLGPGDIFPIAFSSNMDWSTYQIKYFYQSLNETKLESLPIDDFRQHTEANSEMMNIYMSYMAASNEAILRQLEVMKNKKAIDKVGLLLPYLVSKAGRQIKPGLYQLQIKLSHQELADLSGVTRETTTTLIKQLEKAGVINQKKGKWLINTKNLHEIAPAD